MYILDLIQQTSLVQAFAFILSVIVAVTFHEFAHAWAADRLGDDTPRSLGRLTLNPLAHLNIYGSLLFLLAGFGWGNPVPYNPNNLGRKVDELLVALAGPASNLLMALVVYAALTLEVRTGINLIQPEILQVLGALNVLLASFNMLPIPPLDGSSIVAYFWPQYRSIAGGQIGFILLIILVLLPGSLLQAFIGPISNFFTFLVTLGGNLFS